MPRRTTPRNTDLALSLADKSDDPVRFFGNVGVAVGKSVMPFFRVWQPFQHEWIAALAPTLAAVRQRQKPSAKRFLFDGTKGCGKDFILALAILYLLISCRWPIRIEVGANDREQADEVRKSILEILAIPGELNRLLAKVLEVSADKIVNTATGGTMFIKCRDARGGHGTRPDVTVVDELTHIEDEEFALTLADNATKMASGVLLVATNAGHLGTWQHRWKQQAVDSPHWQHFEYKQVAPWLDPADIEDARRRNPPARFSRLYHGAWVDLSGDALGTTDIYAAVVDGLAQEPVKGEQYAGGLDLATASDNAAWCVTGKLANGQLFVRRLRVWRPPGDGQLIDLQRIEDEVAADCANFKIRCSHCDPHESVHMVQRLQRMGHAVEIRHQVGKHQVDQAAELLGSFRDRMIRIPDDARLVRELKRIEILEKSYGFRIHAERTKDGHADAVTALALSLTAARTLRGGRSSFVVDPSSSVVDERRERFFGRLAAADARVAASLTPADRMARLTSQPLHLSKSPAETQHDYRFDR